MAAFPPQQNPEEQSMDLRLVAALAGALLSAAAQGQSALKGDPAKAQQIVTQVCAACHNADGNSTIPANPVIASQHADYAFKQLINLKAASPPSVRAR
jgi:cytochrome c553